MRKSWPLLASSKRLRVVVDTSEKGAVTFDNKESRKRELVTENFGVGCLRANTLPAILTRVQYAELRISGREGKLAMPRSGNGSATRLLVRLSLWITRAVMLLNFYCRGLILGNPQKFLLTSLTNLFSSLQTVL